MERVFASADLLCMIIVHLRAARGRALCRFVCKDWCRIVSADRARCIWGGAPSYRGFALEMKRLSAVHQLLCADGTWTTDFAYETARTHFQYDAVLMLMAPARRFEVWTALRAGLLDLEDLGQESWRFILNRLFASDAGICALHRRTITFDAMRKMRGEYLLAVFISTYGVSVLTERLVSLEDVSVIPNAQLVRVMFNSLSVVWALRNGEKWAALGSAGWITWEGGFDQTHIIVHLDGDMLLPMKRTKFN